MRILVADDERDSWTLLKDILSPFGECDRAANGQEAIEAFELATVTNEPYDLICLDIMMPGINGQEVLKRIRADESRRRIDPADEAAVFMISALFSKEQQAEAFANGCTTYLVKPITREKLVGKLQEHFEISLPKDLAQGNEDERRGFSRPLFHSRSLLSLTTGEEIPGHTRNVSFNGILFEPLDPAIQPGAGVEGLIRVALHDTAALEDSFVAFPCAVVRCTDEGIALKMTPQASAMFSGEEAAGPGKIAVARSDGRIDTGWEILGFNARVPDDVMQSLRNGIRKQAQQGPVVVCYKKGDAGSQNAFKVVNVRTLKEIQKLAGTDDS